MLLRLKKSLESKRVNLQTVQDSCPHVWKLVKYSSKVLNKPTYEIQHKDSESFHVQVGTSIIRRDQWGRTCRRCGKTEYLTQSTVCLRNSGFKR